MEEEELTLKISKKLIGELERVSSIIGYDVLTLVRVTLEDHALGYETYMDNIAFGSYKQDKAKLEEIFKDSPEILDRLNRLHDRISSAPDEDKRVEILAMEYEKFYAELYKDHREVRLLHIGYECLMCGKRINPDFLCQACREKKQEV
ncbi:MAG: hypothetical protein HWN66_02970 [Candidatus Helarchaeota archaeon]|nr:hypothetical protein [Candidatus Helarchaeota archaeon]